MESALFKGLKVIDCASYIAAPAAATVLSDFGADVIKIEPPEGDAYRALYTLPGSAKGTRNYPWEMDSRNKRSLCLDLKNAAGLAALHRLLTSSDVFITNLPFQVRKRLDIGHESLCALNARLIYASFTAYGETGPEADKPGFDATAYWARSGLMDMIRPQASAPPSRAVAGLGDHPSGITLFAAIVSALYRRERTGKGGLVSSSLLANGVWSNALQIQASLFGSTFAPRGPREQAPNPMSNIYQCRDGRWLNLVILNEARQFEPLLEALGCPEMGLDQRFRDAAARRANHVALIALLDQYFAQRDLSDWRVRLDQAGISFGVIGTMDDVAGDVQMRASGALVPFADGEEFTVSAPFDIEGSAKRAPQRAPQVIGEHSDEILSEAGFSAGEIRDLRATGALGG